MQDWLGQPPNWVIQAGIGAILGAIFGLTLPVLLQAIRWLLNARRKHILHGNWKCYYFSTSDGKRVFKSEEWRVSRSLRFPLAIHTKSTVSPSIEYQGYMIMENDHILVEMDSVSGYKEKVHIRFAYPQKSREGPIVGIGVQYDYDGCPEATVNVLSKDELSESAFRDLIKPRVLVLQDHMLLRCE